VNESEIINGKNSLAVILKKATENLYYISETDAEFEPFLGLTASAVTKEEILRQTGKSLDETIEERDFRQIFERLTKIQDWYGEEETATVEKFARLRKILLEKLRDLKVFKVGRIELDIYFVGLDEDGKLAGVKTKAVET
jgi:hypothetical protein